MNLDHYLDDCETSGLTTQQQPKNNHLIPKIYKPQVVPTLFHYIPYMLQGQPAVRPVYLQ